MKPSIVNPALTDESTKYTAIRVFKFGEECHMKALLEKGQIYCKSIQELRSGEDDHRYDSYEGVLAVDGIMPNSPITLENPTLGKIEFKTIEGSSVTLNEITHGNLYCLYSLSALNFKESNTTTIDKRIAQFGSHVVIIHDVAAFMQRVIAKVQELGLKAYASFVHYYEPNTHQGPINIYNKRKIYEYERELRVYIEREATDAVTLEIGSIENIAELRPADFTLKYTFSIPAKAEAVVV